jgi:transcriptional regulator with XRE-family HTH domain
MARGGKAVQGVVEQMREAIRTSGLSLGELARRSGVSLPQVSRFYRGLRDLSFVNAARVLEALGARVVWPDRPPARKAADRPGPPAGTAAAGETPAAPARRGRKGK